MMPGKGVTYSVYPYLRRKYDEPLDSYKNYQSLCGAILISLLFGVFSSYKIVVGIFGNPAKNVSDKRPSCWKGWRKSGAGFTNPPQFSLPSVSPSCPSSSSMLAPACSSTKSRSWSSSSSGGSSSQGPPSIFSSITLLIPTSERNFCQRCKHFVCVEEINGELLRIGTASARKSLFCQV